MTNLENRPRFLAVLVVFSLLGTLGCAGLCFVPTDDPPPTLRFAGERELNRPDITCAADPFAALIIIATIALDGGDYDVPGNQFLTSVGQTTPPSPGLVRIEFTALDEPADLEFISEQLTSTDGVLEAPGLDPARRFLGSGGAAQAASGRAFFVNPEQNTIALIDTATGQTLRQVRVGSDPRGVAASRDGSMLYVANRGSGSVTPVDAVTLEPSPPISLNGAGLSEDVAVSPDGKTLYVVNGADSGSLFFIDTETREIIGNLRTGRQPTKVALSPDGSTAYVANTGGGNVAVVDTLSQTVVGTLNVSAAADIVVSVDGETVYVVAGVGAGRVAAFDAATFQQENEWNVGEAPRGIALSPDGNLLFVTNTQSERLFIIDLILGRVVGAFPVPRGLGPVVVLPGA